MYGMMYNVAKRAMVTPRRREGFHLVRAQITGITKLAPMLLRLTIHSADLKQFDLLGPDEYFGLVMPPPGKDLILPTSNRLDLRKDLAAMPANIRPNVRWYTIRHFRPQSGEMDVDIVIHNLGPGGEFLGRVKIGDEVGIRQASASYLLPPAGTRQLLIADETSHPALCSISELVRDEGLSPDTFTVAVETPNRDYLEKIDYPFAVEILERGSQKPGSLALPWLNSRQQEFREQPWQSAWLCGESQIATGARRTIVKGWGVDRRKVCFSGYWRLGKARP